MSFVDLSAVCGGGGSRRTTQRIFGNECRRYFGSAENYDESLLDQNEVYSFEGLEESGNARMLQEMTLRVFVYDGTLTFALRTDNNAAAALRMMAQGRCKPSAESWLYAEVPPVLAAIQLQSYEKSLKGACTVVTSR